MKTIFIIGDDKLGRAAIVALGKNEPIWLNRTMNPFRVLKLVRKGVVTIPELMRMVFADWNREDHPVPNLPVIKTNEDVLQLIEQEKPQRVICYRAGLVFKSEILKRDIQFLNIHCADLPHYGGLGSVSRALRDGAFDQNACLHEMEAKIDSGHVLHREPYQLSGDRAYKENEDTAYEAGRRVLVDVAKGRVRT